MNNRYTWAMFANDCIKLANEELIDDTARFIEQAQKLIAQQEKKREYNANKEKKSTTKKKELTAEQVTECELVKSVLGVTPLTAYEINEKLKTEFTPIEIYRITQRINGVISCKVTRETTNSNGDVVTAKYTAYKLGQENRGGVFPPE